MKRSRFSEEQIIGILKEHQAGMTAAELCRKHGICDASINGVRDLAGWKSRTPIASLFLCIRLDASSSHDPKLNFGQLRGRIRMM